MKMAEWVSDLQEVIPRLTARRLAALLIIIAAFLLAVVLLLLVSHFVPPAEFERFGYLGVFLANLLPSLSVIIPAHLFLPGQALSVVVAATGSLVVVAILASLGSTLGEITAYYVGYGGKNLFNLERFSRYKAAEKWVRRRGEFAVALFAFLPLFFFDFVGIAAGAFRMPLCRFLFFCYLGRLPRAFLEIYFYTWVFEHVLVYLPRWMSGPYLHQASGG
jgi:membrane protein YqaA with SNARE-associated domain